MSQSRWRDRLQRAAWGHPVGRAATFAVVALAAAAAAHGGNTEFDPFVPLVSSTAGWAVSLVRWPPDVKS